MKKAINPGKLFSLFLPRKCILCGHILERSEDGICTPCKKSMPWRDGVLKNDSLLPHTVAIPLRYESEVREALHRFKFDGLASYADVFGALLADEIHRAYGVAFDILTWVPVSARRHELRGFDQAELLAKEVAGVLKSPYTATLVKCRHNREQSTLGASARHSNVRDVYTMHEKVSVDGARLLLIDDIYTTGETMNSAAEVLIAAGARSVVGAAVAQAGTGCSPRRASADITPGSVVPLTIEDVKK